MPDRLGDSLLGFELLGLPAALALSVLGVLLAALLWLHAAGRRPRRITVSSLAPWHLVGRAPTRALGSFARVGRRSLRLFLGVAFLCLCVAAATQPWPTPESHNGEHHVLLIDCSSAMAGRLDRARARALQFVETLAARDRLAVIAFSDTPQVLTGFDPRPDIARAAIAGLTLRPGAPDRARALRLADALLAGVPRPRRTLIEARDLGPEDNLCITAFGARRRPGHPSTVDVVVGVRNLANLPSEADVRVTGPKGPVLTAHVRLEPDEIRTLTTEALLSASGAYTLFAHVSGAPGRDTVPDDSYAELSLPPYEPWQILLVGERQLFVEGALLSMGDAVAFERVPAARLANFLVERARILDDWDLVIIEGKSPFTSLPSHGLPAGRFLLLGATGPGLPYRVRGTLDAPIVTELRSSHPLLAHLSLRELNVARALHIDPSPGFEILASSFGRPLVLAGRVPGGLTAAVVLAFDPRQSDLPLRPAWPLLLSNILEHFSKPRGRDGASSVVPEVGPVAAVQARLQPPIDLRADQTGASPSESVKATPAARWPAQPHTRNEPSRGLALLAFLVLCALLGPEIVHFFRARRSRRVLARLATLVLIGLALLDPRVRAAWPPVTRLVVLHDRSESMHHLEPTADRFIAALRAAASASKMVEAPRVLALADPEATDLEHGLGLAQAALHGARSGHVIVISDGAETRGQAVRALPWFARHGVPVTMLRPAPEQQAVEIQPLLRIETPNDVSTGRPFNVEVVVSVPPSPRATANLAQVELLRDGQPIASWPRGPERTASEWRWTFPLILHDSTPVVLEARLAPATVPARVVIRANRPPRVLLVAQDPGEAAGLRALLLRQSIDVTMQRPAAAAANDLNGFDLVVLVDLPAGDISKDWVKQLEAWVEGGGGLLIVGGPNSFGEGGYQDAAIAHILPVVPRVLAQRERPALALALVIDRSGSMSGAKMDLTKEAARKAVLGLRADDLLSVVAFDSRAEVVVRLQSAGNRQRILSQIDRITSGGGTSIVPAVREGYQQLLGAAASRKHIIVLSDGQSSSTGLRALIQDATAADMTISAIAVGAGAERSLLRQLAELGGGRFHLTEDVFSIPRVFAREVESVRPLGQTPEGVRVRPIARAQVLDGIAWKNAPPIHGHNAATPRAGAQVLLATTDGAPLFVRWHRGLGQVATWHSDLGARWSSRWPTWPGFSRFWTQVVRALVRANELQRLPLRAVFERDEAVISIDASSSSSHQPATGLAGTLLVHELPVRALPKIVPLVETSPGLYEGRIRAATSGAWWFSARLHANAHTRAEDIPQDAAYFAEGGLSRAIAFELEPPARSELDRLAGALRATGGGMRAEPLAPANLAAGLRQPRALIPMAPFLLMVGAILFVATLGIEHANFRSPKN